MTNAAWALLCEAGFWGWVCSATGFALGSFPSRKEFNRRSALKWGGAFLVAYILWIVGMMRA